MAAVAAGLLVATLGACGGGSQMPGGAVSRSGSSLASRAASGTPQPTLTPVPPSQSAPPPAPASSGPPASAGTIRLSNQDDGGSFAVRVGITVSVSLTGAPSYRWTELASSNDAVLRRTGSVTRTDGSATATFLVLARGSAQVSSTDNPTCYPQCLPPSRLWRVTISVAG